MMWEESRCATRGGPRGERPLDFSVSSPESPNRGQSSTGEDSIAVAQCESALIACAHGEFYRLRANDWENDWESSPVIPSTHFGSRDLRGLVLPNVLA